MRIFEGFDHSGEIVRPVATIGSYDGVHIGHRHILALLQQTAAQRDGETTLITFHPHPRQVLHPDEPLFLLNTLSEKLELLESPRYRQRDSGSLYVGLQSHLRHRFRHHYLVRSTACRHPDRGAITTTWDMTRPVTARPCANGVSRRASVSKRCRANWSAPKKSAQRSSEARSPRSHATGAQYLGAPYPLHGVLHGDRLTEVDPIKLLPPPGRYPIQWTSTFHPTPLHDTLIVEEARQLRLQGLLSDFPDAPIAVKFQ